MKILYAILAVLFALFAYFQFNDPDPIQWAVIYGLVSVLCILAATGRFPKGVLLAVAALSAGWMLYMVPGFIEWIKSGMPSITSEMRTHEPHIEVVREFLGLFMAFATVMFLLVRAFKYRS